MPALERFKRWRSWFSMGSFLPDPIQKVSHFYADHAGRANDAFHMILRHLAACLTRRRSRRCLRPVTGSPLETALPPLYISPDNDNKNRCYPAAA